MRKTIVFFSTVLLSAFLTTTHAQWVRMDSLGYAVTSFTAMGNTLFASHYGRGIFRSKDTGTTWTEVNNGLTDLDVNALAVIGSNLFLGTNGGGVFLSADSGE